MKLLRDYRKNVLKKGLSALLGAGMMFMSYGVTPAATENGKWITGDFHQHTTYSDGSYSYGLMMDKNNYYGLDWWAQSGHGGGFTRWGKYGVDTGGDVFFDLLPSNPIIGDVKFSGGHQIMWRWQSLRDWAFLDCLEARDKYPEKVIIQGVEWNVPGHEHCSVSNINEQFNETNPNCKVLAEFDYKFDKNDADITGGAAQGWIKSALPNLHPKSVEAVAWLQNNYPRTSYAILAHPERQGPWVDNKTSTGYNIEHFRDMNNAAPDVCFGFESIPGHQADPERGGYSPSKAFGGTYGGAGIYSAKIGGLWDALLGEGRRWWLFANSDCHLHYSHGGDDFWPGEYQKTYTFVQDSDGNGTYSAQEIVDGLRSGNSFCVNGDLISELEFTARNREDIVTMGGELSVPKGNKNPIIIKIKFKSPSLNNNGDVPVVDHIDLIEGEITGKVSPSDPNYTKAVNETTKVIATFTSADWEVEDGYNVIVYNVKADKSKYYRLRGTNVPPNTPYETDAEGNPLADYLATDHLSLDKAQEAWADLWFYSNPIFVYVK